MNINFKDIFIISQPECHILWQYEVYFRNQRLVLNRKSISVIYHTLKASLYTNKKIIIAKVSFTITPKKLKYLGTNLKSDQNLCKDFRTHM